MSKILLVFKSPLHDQESVLAVRKPMTDALEVMGVRIVDASEAPAFDSDDRIVCFIGTGGTEEIFRDCFLSLKAPVVLLSDAYHNSFAASFEIASFLSQKGVAHRLVNIPLGCCDFGFIAGLFEDAGACLQKGPEYDFSEAESLYARPEVAEKLRSAVIGLVGGASSWLIASDVDTDYVSAKTGARFVRIPIAEVEYEYKARLSSEQCLDPVEIKALDGRSARDLGDAVVMYRALEAICEKYGLTALTLKCFDLLGSCGTTACYALAKLNDRGIISGCEGDIPSLWSMIVASAISGKAPFMANPSSSDSTACTVDFAHCTIPFRMVRGFRLPSHFESRIGIGIAGKVPEGEYSIFKIGGTHLDKVFSCRGSVICNTCVPERCRTQIRFLFRSAEDYVRFMENRTGNHIILMP